MTYDEQRYWERRYRCGGASGPGLPLERRFLVERVVKEARAHDVGEILDIGIGDGGLASDILGALHGSPAYTGVDISASGLDRARENLPEAVTLNVADVVRAPVSSFDMVLCFNVHYHMATPVRAAQLVRNTLLSARKIVMFLTWNERVLKRGALAPHCHFRPLSLPDDSDFVLDVAERIPSSPHKTLYTMVRANRERRKT